MDPTIGNTSSREESRDWEDDAVMIDRSDVGDFNEGNILPQSPETLKKCREWLKATNYTGEDSEIAKHQASHVRGTGQWLLESGPYKEWHSSTDKGILWIRGIPGSGKSVFAAKLVDHLCKEGTTVLYFFFRQIIDANHSPIAPLRDWLDQLLESSPPLQEAIKKHVDSRHNFESVSTADLWRHLRTALSQLPRVYFVVDALDEMDRGDAMNSFLGNLADLGKWRPSQVKVVMTSRPVQYVEGPLRPAKPLDIRLDPLKVDVDISTCVAHRLSASDIAPEHHSTIKQAIPGRANGLFLYAKLAMDALVEPNANIEQVLQDLPLDLNAMYEDLLHEHARRSGVPEDIQLLIMLLVTHSTRPLRLLEIAQLIDVTQYPEEKRDLKATKQLVRSACGPLLEILPTEVVCVVHHSLTEFLTGSTRDATSSSYPVLEYAKAHGRFALLCLSYLSSQGLKEVRRSPYFDDQYTSYYASGFTIYAGSNWYIHARKSAEAGGPQHEINIYLDKLFDGEDFNKLTMLSHSDFRFQFGDYRTPLLAAVVLGLDEYATLLLARGGGHVNMGAGTQISPLGWASKKGYTKLVKILLQHGADPTEIDCGYPNGKSPLHHAAAGNHHEIVTLLLKAGADPLSSMVDRNEMSCGPPEDSSSLRVACTHGHVEAVAAILPFIKTEKTFNRALCWAAGSTQPGVVEFLLKHPSIQVNALVNGVTPLMRASARHDFEMVELLLAAGADVGVRSTTANHTQIIQGHTALHSWAARNVYPEFLPCSNTVDEEMCRKCFQALIRAGANIHQTDERGNTPLLVARSLPTLKLLVESGADPNASDIYGRTKLHHESDKSIVKYLVEEAKASNPVHTPYVAPLLVALRKADVDKALLLVERGADVTAVDSKGDGVFHHLVLIAERENDRRVELLEALCSAGADINLQNKKGQTAIHQIRSSQTGLDPVLLPAMVSAKADLEIKDHKGRSPLFTQTSNISAMEALVAAGASLKTTDFEGRNLLHATAGKGYCNLQSVDWLIKHGLDANTTDFGGRTFLHDFVLPNNMRPSKELGPSMRETISRITELGVDFLRSNHAGRTPLHTISSTTSCLETLSWPNKGLSTMFEYFLEAYPDVNGADNAGVTALHLAATACAYHVKLLLEAGADPSIKTNEGMTAVHLAARARQPNIVGMLLQSLERRLGREGMISVLDLKAREGQTALYYACASGIPESVKLLLDAGSSTDGGHIAMAIKGCAIFEAENANWPLLKGHDGPVYDSDDDDPSLDDVERTLRKYNKYEIVLPRAGSVSMNGRSRKSPVRGEGIFPIARLEDILSLLRTYTPSLSSIDAATDQAARRGFDYTVRCFLEMRAGLDKIKPVNLTHDILVCIKKSESVRHACETGFQETVGSKNLLTEFNFLMTVREYGLVRNRLSKDDCLDFQLNSANKLTVFHDLVDGGFVSILKEALTPSIIYRLENAEWRQETAREKNIRESAFESLLVAACRRETPNMEIIKLLVEHFKLDVNSQNRRPNRGSNNYGCETALHVLARGSHWWQVAQAIPYLVEHGADLEARDDKGLTPLHAALAKRNEFPSLSMRAFEVLVRLGADVNSADDRGTSCIMRTVGAADYFVWLLGNGANIGTKELFTNIHSLDTNVLELALQHGVDPNERFLSFNRNNGRNDQLKYPLHFVGLSGIAEETRETMFKLLLKYGADPCARYENTTVAHYLIAKSSFAAFVLDLPSLKIEETDHDGLSLFLPACKRAFDGERSLPRILLNRGVDILARDNKRRNALHYLLEMDMVGQDPELLQQLAAEPELINSADNEGQTPLFLSIRRYRRAISESNILIEAGADPWIADKKGNTLLHHVFDGCLEDHAPIEKAGEEHATLLDYLVSLPSSQAYINARNDDGETPIFGYFRQATPYRFSEKDGPFQQSKLTRLSTMGFDWSVKSNSGQNLLHVVAEEGILWHFQYLMDEGVDPHAEDKDQRTPLDIAAERRREDILALFGKEG